MARCNAGPGDTDHSAVSPSHLFGDGLGRAIILEGPARAHDELVLRTRFIDTAWTHHQDWIRSDPCPIRDFRAFELQEDVHCTLVMLNEMVREDMRVSRSNVMTSPSG